MIISMRQMKVGEEGVISAVNASGELGRRIREMGLVPGTSLSVQGKAPLRDPVAVRLTDFVMSLRNGEADHIEVEVNR